MTYSVFLSYVSCSSGFTELEVRLKKPYFCTWLDRNAGGLETWNVGLTGI